MHATEGGVGFVTKLPVVLILINIIKCIDTNPIKLTIPRLGQGLRKIDTNPITLTNQRLARGSLNQRLGQAFFESLPINVT